MKVVAESNWRWMLFVDGDSYILSIICGSVGLSTIEISLSANEAADYVSSGGAPIERLAEDVCRHPKKNRSRRVLGFSQSQAAKVAAEEWRVSHAQKP